MIEGYGLKLSQPMITFESTALVCNPEVEPLIIDIRLFFNQTNKIYDAEITLSNNEYRKFQGKYGPYLKRIDTSFNLRFLTEIRLYDDYIIFKTVDEEYKINIGKDFFYFLEWEHEYYQ